MVEHVLHDRTITCLELELLAQSRPIFNVIFHITNMYHLIYIHLPHSFTLFSVNNSRLG